MEIIISSHLCLFFPRLSLHFFDMYSDSSLPCRYASHYKVYPKMQITLTIPTSTNTVHRHLASPVWKYGEHHLVKLDTAGVNMGNCLANNGSVLCHYFLYFGPRKRTNYSYKSKPLELHQNTVENTFCWCQENWVLTPAQNNLVHIRIWASNLPVSSLIWLLDQMSLWSFPTLQSHRFFSPFYSLTQIPRE